MAAKPSAMITRVPALEFVDVWKKLVIVGNAAVGKTSFIRRVSDGVFSKDYIVTIAGDSSDIFYTINKTSLRLQMWDTCGLEHYRSLNSLYFRKADVVLITFDSTNVLTLEGCSDWIRDVRERTDPSILIYLLGTKTDLGGSPAVREIASGIVAKHGLSGMFMVSAKNGDNIDETMTTILQDLAPGILSKPHSKQVGGSIRTTATGTRPRHTSCAC